VSLFYSLRSITFGSSRDARQAGSQHATTDTSVSVTATEANVGISVRPIKSQSRSIFGSWYLRLLSHY